MRGPTSGRPPAGHGQIPRGLAVAVLLHATIVRLLFVPATTELLVDKNWWLPRWLERLLPRVNVRATRVARRRGLPGASTGLEMSGQARARTRRNSIWPRSCTVAGPKLASGMP